MHISFQIPESTIILIANKEFKKYVYDFTRIRKLCKQQAKVIQHHENIYVRNTGQGEARHRKYKRFKLGGGQEVIKFVLQPEQTFMGQVYYNEPGLNDAKCMYYAYMNYRYIMQ
jgi:hypothetical protein